MRLNIRRTRTSTRLSHQYRPSGPLRAAQSQTYTMFISKTILLYVFHILSHAHGLPTTASTQDHIDRASKGWSVEAILALVGILVAVLCCVVSLTWPRWWTASGSRLARSKLNTFHEAVVKLTLQVPRADSMPPVRSSGNERLNTRPPSRRYFRSIVIIEQVEIGS